MSFIYTPPSSPLQQNTLLGGVHRSADLALEGLCKVVQVLDDAVDAPFLGGVAVIAEHLDGFLRGHVAAVCARVLDEEQLFGRVPFQTRKLPVVMSFARERERERKN